MLFDMSGGFKSYVVCCLIMVNIMATCPVVAQSGGMSYYRKLEKQEFLDVPHSDIRKIRTLIFEYDVKDFVFEQPKVRTASDFWMSVFQNNRMANSMIEAINRKGRLIMQAADTLAVNMANVCRYCNNIATSDEYQFVADSLMSITQASIAFPNVACKIADDNTLNACALPNGQIFINGGLLGIMSYPEIIGVVSHEIAHVILEHQLAHEYMMLKKRRGLEIASAVMMGINTAAAGFGAANGVETDWDDVKKTNQELADSPTRYVNEFYTFKYSREQEIEADIVAYRFLDFMCDGGEYYISALQKLSSEDEKKFYDKQCDHPTTAFRINLLRYLRFLDKFPEYAASLRSLYERGNV